MYLNWIELHDDYKVTQFDVDLALVLPSFVYIIAFFLYFSNIHSYGIKYSSTKFDDIVMNEFMEWPQRTHILFDSLFVCFTLLLTELDISHARTLNNLQHVFVCLILISFFYSFSFYRTTSFCQYAIHIYMDTSTI